MDAARDAPAAVARRALVTLGACAAGTLAAFGHALLPACCPLCEEAVAAGPAALCGYCLAVLPGHGARRCPRCALAVPGQDACRSCGESPGGGAPGGLDSAIALADYGAPLSRLILALKYQGRAALAGPLGRALADHVARTQPAPAWPQLLVPVPLSDARLRWRGYNQALLLARSLGRSLRLPVAAAGLRRAGDGGVAGSGVAGSGVAGSGVAGSGVAGAGVGGARVVGAGAVGAGVVGAGADSSGVVGSRAVGASPADGAASQTGRSRRDRRLAAQGGFSGTPALAGLRIAIIDDVMTTGATLQAAAAAARAAGAVRVDAWVVARTPQGQAPGARTP